MYRHAKAMIVFGRVAVLPEQLNDFVYGVLVSLSHGIEQNEHALFSREIQFLVLKGHGALFAGKIDSKVIARQIRSHSIKPKGFRLSGEGAQNEIDLIA
jgi:hypothetical protein